MPDQGRPSVRLGTFSTLSIGIGGMVGGGIFAVTGLTVQVTRGAAPLAFLLAGLVALLTSYSYLRLTLRFPGEGGTVEFLNRAFGGGILTGAANILLLLSYVVLLAVYAYAFGSYGASFFPEPDRGFWLHVLITGVILALVVVNAFGADLVVRSEKDLRAGGAQHRCRPHRAVRRGGREPRHPQPPVDAAGDDRGLRCDRVGLPPPQWAWTDSAAAGDGAAPRRAASASRIRPQPFMISSIEMKRPITNRLDAGH